MSGRLHHINSSIESTTPTSPVPPHILDWVSPIARDFSTFSSASRSSADIPMKKNFFRIVAKSFANLLRKQKSASSFCNESADASTSALHQSLMVRSNNNLSKRPNNWGVKRAATSDGVRLSSSNRREASRNLFRFNICDSFHEKSAKSRVTRCEEFICSSPDDNQKYWENHEFEFMRNQADQKSTSVGIASPDNVSSGKESRPRQQTRMSSIKITSMFSWARRVQKKRKFRSENLFLFRHSDDVNNITDHDNAYEVLRYLQTLPKSSLKSENRYSVTNFSNYDVISPSICSNQLSELKAVALHPDVPVCDHRQDISSKCFDDPMDRQRKREKFAQNRGIAFTEDQSKSLLSLATQRMSVSNDDYVTCSERLSFTNLPLTSCYTTASER